MLTTSGWKVQNIWCRCKVEKKNLLLITCKCLTENAISKDYISKMINLYPKLCCKHRAKRIYHKVLHTRNNVTMSNGQQKEQACTHACNDARTCAHLSLCHSLRYANILSHTFSGLNSFPHLPQNTHTAINITRKAVNMGNKYNRLWI